MNRTIALACLILGCAVLVGCGTTRTTDTVRSATEMLLISQAIDSAVAQFDFSRLDGKLVFLDTQFLDSTVDKGYLISSLRQQLLAHGALVSDERFKAEYVVEPRCGSIGTDKNSLLIGTPQMAVPGIIPGVPSQIPEIAFVKKTDQRGVAKLAVFAYNRATGEALWQSGLVQANSTMKDTWIFGAGPISRGSIKEDVEIAGETLPKFPLPLPRNPFHLFPDGENEHGTNAPIPGYGNAFQIPHGDTTVPFGMLGLTGPAALIDRSIQPPQRAAPIYILEPPAGLLNPSAPEGR